MDRPVHHAEGKNSHFMLFGHWEQQLLKHREMVHFKCRVQISDPEHFPDLCEKLGNFTLWWKTLWMWGELGRELAWWHCLENWEEVGKQLARETPGNTNLLLKEQKHMLSKGANTPQEVKRRWRTELLALLVSDWKCTVMRKDVVTHRRCSRGRPGLPIWR